MLREFLENPDTRDSPLYKDIYSGQGPLVERGIANSTTRSAESSAPNNKAALFLFWTCTITEHY
jgi:hypothetical protein